MVSASRREAMSRNTPPCGLPRPAFTSALIARATSSRGSSSGGRRLFFLSVVPAVGLGLGVGGLLLEELGDVIEHETAALRVAQHATVAPHALGDQDAPHAVGPDHPGGMELVALHVDQVGAGLQRHRHPVAGVLPGVGGELPGLADAAGGEDHRLGLEAHELPRLPPVAEGPGDPVAVLEQADQGALHVDGDALVHRVLLERADHLQPGAVSDVGQPGVAMASEVALEDPPVLGPVEERAPLLQLQHPGRCLLGVELGHPPVVEELSSTHGVAEVDLPVVLRPDVAQRGGDAALGHHRVRLAEERLADQCGVGSLRRGLDGRPEPGSAGADDDHVVLVGLVLRHQKNLRSWMAPLATSRT